MNCKPPALHYAARLCLRKHLRQSRRLAARRQHTAVYGWMLDQGFAPAVATPLEAATVARHYCPQCDRRLLAWAWAGPTRVLLASCGGCGFFVSM